MKRHSAVTSRTQSGDGDCSDSDVFYDDSTTDLIKDGYVINFDSCMIALIAVTYMLRFQNIVDFGCRRRDEKEITLNTESMRLICQAIRVSMIRRLHVYKYAHEYDADLHTTHYYSINSIGPTDRDCMEEYEAKLKIGRPA
jgi:c-di-GMP-related signal transduction protein